MYCDAIEKPAQAAGYHNLNEAPMSVSKAFAHHKPSSDACAKIAALRRAFSDLARVIEESAPGTREKAVAITHLETACMWATKAVAVNDPKAEIDTQG